jgi:2,4-dienoyl-CoA reductase-like NADH-dependent reductase (Old Yellow Enzyme family)
MAEVFQPAEIAGIKLKNRILRSATHEGMCDAAGMPTETLTRKYEQLARGGVGAIITGYAGVMPNGKSSVHHMAMIHDDASITRFREMVDRVHQHDTPIILQLAHSGRQTRSAVTGLPTVAPSPIRDKVYNETTPHELSTHEIHEIIDNFVRAVFRAKSAGFDGVQFHMAHGYLLSSFLSPHMNKRKDRWGGSTRNRLSIVKELFLETRAAVGSYPILVKMNAYEKARDGLKSDEAIEIAKALEDYGCDAIEVSCGIEEDGFLSARGPFPFEAMAAYNFRLAGVPKIVLPLMKIVSERRFGSPQPYDLFNLQSAEAIKRNVTIPVILVGGVNKLSDIEYVVQNSKCDFVSMARPLIREPGLVNKFREGRQTEAKCIRCNYCLVAVGERSLQCYNGKLPKPIRQTK